MSIKLKQPTMRLATLFLFGGGGGVNLVMRWNGHVFFSHPPKRRRVTYASTIRPASASASTLSTSMKPLHGIISYCTCILV